MKLRHYVVLVCLSWIYGLTSVFAIQIPEPDERVTDMTGMLTEREEGSLESSLQQLHDETGVEVAFLVIDTTNGHDHAQYAVEVAEARGIGKADIDNGILILIALEDRQIEISTGYGVEGVVPDATAYDIASLVWVPYARAEEYYTGASEIVTILSGLIHEDPEMIGYRNENKPHQTTDPKNSSPLSLLMFMGMMGGRILGSSLRTQLKSSIAKMIALGAIPGGWTLIAVWIVGAAGAVVLVPTLMGSFAGLFSDKGSSPRRGSGGVFFPGGGSLGGLGSSGGSFGGGFGGFGGGSFGGGGAGASR